MRRLDKGSTSLGSLRAIRQTRSRNALVYAAVFAASLIGFLPCSRAAQVPPDDDSSSPTSGSRYKTDWAEHSFAINGVVPIWESSGRTLALRQAYLGTSHVQVGLGKGILIGLRPIPYPSGAPNLHGRFRILSTKSLDVALQVEGMILLPGAGNSFASSNFKSRINNWTSAYLVVPLSLAATWQPAKWLSLNQSLTLLSVLGLFEPNARVTLGYFVTLELLPLSRHGILLHLGEVGFWDHDFVTLGASYRFNYRSFEARIGYLYRRSVDGGQGAPMLSIGFLL